MRGKNFGTLSDWVPAHILFLAENACSVSKEVAELGQRMLDKPVLWRVLDILRSLNLNASG